MTKLTPRYSKEEFLRRGQTIYEQDILPKLGGGNNGKIVAIDIDSGEFVLDADSLRAAQALRARLPQAQIWCVRIGQPAVDRIGSLIAGHRLSLEAVDGGAVALEPL